MPRGLEQALTAVLYAVFGALAATITTFAHRARIDVFGHAFWYGIVLGVVCLLALAVGVRLYLRERWASYGFAIGVFAAVAWIAYLHGGHSVIVVNDVAGNAWIIASILVVVVVTFWPRLPARDDDLEPDDVMTPSLPASAEPDVDDARTAAGGAAEYPGIIRTPPDRTPKEPNK